MSTPDFDERAARLRRATEAIVAPPGFTENVMAALAPPLNQREPGLLESVPRFGKLAVALAALAAAVSLFATFDVEDRLDVDTLAAFPEVDLAE